MAKRRPRGLRGLVPWIGHLLIGGARWFVRHPQPVVLLLLLAAGGMGVWHVAIRSEAFQVTNLVVPPNSPLRMPESVRGQNLWAVNLRVLAEQLHAQQPDLKRVRVVRVPPGTLRLETVERNPVAQVQLGQWHAVADDGFIFPAASPKPWDHVLILKGLGGPPAALKAGRENSHERLALALRLAATLRRSPALAGHQIKMLDVSDPNHLRFLLEDGVEIRCGPEAELARQLERLRSVLQRTARQGLALRYIDVRFKEPVIGPRT